MKINEACKRTGLSERAIRFYVEKGLLEPKSQIINGRTTIEYSEADIEEYFKSPRTMQTGAREYYEAMQITGEAYDTFEIRIEIPYADAREEEILDEDGNVVIEKVLAVDRIVRDYCFIERIDND